MKVLALVLALGSFAAFAQDNGCNRYANRSTYQTAINTVAQHMDYTGEDLCSSPRILEIYVVNTQVDNERHEPIPHIWVTLHYNEYSCQYFVREADYVITKSNCYNTW